MVCVCVWVLLGLVALLVGFGLLLWSGNVGLVCLVSLVGFIVACWFCFGL